MLPLTNCQLHRACPHTANRAKRLGIGTVAVYSDPDASAVHTAFADEAICVGPAASAKSYLNIPRIIDACRATGAQAVHPGYGFLSENAHFGEALAEAGITFIGPGAYALTEMGDKIASKIIAKDANVNTIPGYIGLVENDDEVKKIANEIGYPVMIKASAGGGGKGMRIAWNDAEAVEGFRLSKNEALSSFGDDRIFIEKFIEEPRHIEIQIIADKHGNVVALPERECSIQRRNQKVIEEAPSVLLDPETRLAMGEQACALARAVDYVSAGTVEFLCDKHKNFYFLEMNTRLQVEHPVTEYVSGVDLVEQMLRVAAGHKLPEHLLHGPVPIQGWAIEARVYAEDPLRGFLPSTGRLSRYIEPVGEGVRCDAGVQEGGEISMFYDPMISKLIAHAPTRLEAIERLKSAIDGYVIRGDALAHNTQFCRDVLNHPRFVSGAITTGFIAEEYPDGFHGVTLSEGSTNTLVACAAVMQAVRDATTSLLSGSKNVAAGSAGRAFSERVFVTVDKDEVYEAHIVRGADGDDGDAWTVEVGKCVDAESDAEGAGNGPSNPIAAKFDTVTLNNVRWANQDPILTATTGDGAGDAVILQHLGTTAEGFRLQLEGAMVDVAVRTPAQQRLSGYMLPKPEVDYSKVLVSPMPGVLVSLEVAVGDVVEAGQMLAVVEAMKMQNVLRSPKKARIASIAPVAGDSLAVDEIIMEFEDM